MVVVGGGVVGSGMRVSEMAVVVVAGCLGLWLGCLGGGIRRRDRGPGGRDRAGLCREWIGGCIALWIATAALYTDMGSGCLRRFLSSGHGIWNEVCFGWARERVLNPMPNASLCIAQCVLLA